jgi:hypothetical protein
MTRLHNSVVSKGFCKVSGNNSMFVQSMLQFVCLLLVCGCWFAPTVSASLTVRSPTAVSTVAGSRVLLTPLRVEESLNPINSSYKLALNISTTHGKLVIATQSQLFIYHGDPLSSQRYEVVGGLQQIQYALSGLYYVPESGFVGKDSVIMSMASYVLKFGKMIPVSDPVYVPAIAVTVSEPPAKPELVLSKTVSVVRNTNSSVSVGLSVDTQFYPTCDVLIVASVGQLAIAGTGCSSFSTHCVLTNVSTAAFNRTLANIQLTSNEFDPPMSLARMGELRVSASIVSVGSPITTTTVIATSRVTVSVLEVMPTLTASASVVKALEDKPALVGSNMVLEGVDPLATLRMNISIGVGSIDLQSVAMYIPYQTSDGVTHFVGPLNSMAAMLSKLKYVPPANWYGTDTVNITVSLGNAPYCTSVVAGGTSSTEKSLSYSCVSASFSVVVQSVDDAPTVTSGSRARWGVEDEPVSINDVIVSDADIYTNGVVRMSIVASNGVFQCVSASAASSVYSMVRFADAQSASCGSVAVKTLTVDGTLAGLNAFLAAGLVFVPPRDMNIYWREYATLNFSVYQIDAKTNMSLSDLTFYVINLYFLSVDDPIVMTYTSNCLPAVLASSSCAFMSENRLAVDEDGSMAVGGSVLNITITDPDYDDRDAQLSVYLTISVNYGVIDLLTAYDLYKYDNNLRFPASFQTPTASVTLRGTPASLTYLLASGSILYKPLPNVNGFDDLLTLTALNQLPNSQVSQSNATIEVSVFIRAINDPPKINVPAYIQADEDCSGIVITGVSVSDADIYPYSPQNNLNMLTVSVACEFGSVMSNLGDEVMWLDETLTSSVSYARYEGVYVSKFTVQGPLSGINQLFEALYYAGAKDFNGVDRITIIATDAHGLSTSRTIAVLLSPVNDVPTVTVPLASAVYTLSVSAAAMSSASLHATTSNTRNSQLRANVFANVTLNDADGNGAVRWMQLSGQYGSFDYRQLSRYGIMSALADPSIIASSSLSTVLFIGASVGRLQTAFSNGAVTYIPSDVINSRTDVVSLAFVNVANYTGNNQLIDESMVTAFTESSACQGQGTACVSTNITVNLSPLSMLPALARNSSMSVHLQLTEDTPLVNVPVPVTMYAETAYANDVCSVCVSWSAYAISSVTLPATAQTQAAMIVSSVSNITVSDLCANIASTIATINIQPAANYFTNIGNSLTADAELILPQINVTLVSVISPRSGKQVCADSSSSSTCVFKQTAVSINVFVRSVEDPPTVSVDSMSSLHTMEEVPLPLDFISIVDNNVVAGLPSTITQQVMRRSEPYVALYVCVANGTLDIPTSLFSTVTYTQTSMATTSARTQNTHRVIRRPTWGQPCWYFAGSFEDVNTYFASITYVPPALFSGEDTITINIINTLSKYHTGSDDVYAATEVLTVTVLPVNNAPTILLANSSSIVYLSGAVNSVSMPFIGSSIVDVDSKFVNVTVSVAHKHTSTFAHAYDYMVGLDQEFAQTLSFAAAVGAEVNTLLQSLQFKVSAHTRSSGTSEAMLAYRQRYRHAHVDLVLTVSDFDGGSSNVTLYGVIVPPELPTTIVFPVSAASTQAADTYTMAYRATVFNGVAGPYAFLMGTRVLVSANSQKQVLDADVTTVSIICDLCVFTANINTVFSDYMLTVLSNETVIASTQTQQTLTVRGNVNSINSYLSTFVVMPASASVCRQAYLASSSMSASSTVTISVIDSTTGAASTQASATLVVPLTYFGGKLQVTTGQMVTASEQVDAVTIVPLPYFALSSEFDALADLVAVQLMLPVFTNISWASGTRQSFGIDIRFSSTVDTTGTSVQAVTLYGTVGNVRLALNALQVYPLDPLFNGYFTVSAALTYCSGPCVYSNTSKPGTVYAQVRAVNNPPQVTALNVTDGQVACNQFDNVNCVIWFHMFDPDATATDCPVGRNVLRVFVTANVSDVMFAVLPKRYAASQATTNLIPITNDTASGSMTFLVSWKDRAIFAGGQDVGVRVVPANTSFVGSFSVSVVVDDQGSCGGASSSGQQSSTSMVVDIVDVNDPVTIVNATTHILCSEDNSWNNCSLPAIAVADDDLVQFSEFLYATIVPSHGCLVFDSSSSGATVLTISEVIQVNAFDVNNKSMPLVFDTPTLTGVCMATVTMVTQNLNALLSSLNALKFVPDANFHGVWPESQLRQRVVLNPEIELASVLYTLCATSTASVSLNGDSSCSSTAVSVVHVSVSSMNDAPMITTLNGNDVVPVTSVESYIFATADMRSLVLVEDPDDNAGIVASIHANEELWQQYQTAPWILAEYLVFVDVVVACANAETCGSMTLSLDDTLVAGVNFIEANALPGSQSVLLRGTLEAVNRALPLIVYNAQNQSAVNTQVTITVTDRGNFAQSSSLSSVPSTTASLQITLQYSAVSETQPISLIQTQTQAQLSVSQVNEYLPLNVSMSVSPLVLAAVLDTPLSDNGINYRAIVSASQGELASITAPDAIQEAAISGARSYSLTMQGRATDTKDVYFLESVVDWTYEVQSIQLLVPHGVVNSTQWDSSVSLNMYGINDTMSFSLAGTFDDMANSLQLALNQLQNVKHGVSVTYYVPNTASSEYVYVADLVLTFVCTFSENTGDLPLLVLAGSNGAHFAVTEISAGSRVATVQDLSVLVYNQPAVEGVQMDGSFVIVYPNTVQRSISLGLQHTNVPTDSPSVWHDQFIESGSIPFNASALEMQQVLSLVRGIGVVTVNQTENLAFVSSLNAFRTTWRVTFLTSASHVEPVVLLSTTTSSNSSYPNRQTCPETICLPFTNVNISSGLVLSVNVVTPGTDPVGGSFTLSLTVTENMSQSSAGTQHLFTQVTTPISVFASASMISNALTALNGVSSAWVLKQKCTSQQTCVWSIEIQYEKGISYGLAIAGTSLSGGGRMYLKSGVLGSTALSGYFKLNMQPPVVTPSATSGQSSGSWASMSAGTQSGIVNYNLDGSIDRRTASDGTISTIWLPVGASDVSVQSAVAGALQTVCSNCYEVVVSHNASFTASDTDISILAFQTIQYEISITLVAPTNIADPVVYVRADASLVDTRYPINFIPRVTAVISEIAGTDATARMVELPVSEDILNTHNRYLLSVTKPDIPTTSEVQSFICSTSIPLPTSGWISDADQVGVPVDLQYFTASFRSFTTAPIWIHAFATADNLPNCASVTTGTACKQDGDDLFTKLSALPSIGTNMGIWIESNSTTGRLCPSEPKAVFETKIHFVVPSATSTGSTIVGSTVGDIPPLLVSPAAASNATLFANFTALAIAETVRGSVAAQQEVQMITITTGHSAINSIQLTYNREVSTSVVRLDSSEDTVAAAVAQLLSADSGVTLAAGSVTVSTALSSATSMVWLVTFPANFGRASLLTVVFPCGFSPANSNTVLVNDFSVDSHTTWANCSNSSVVSSTTQRIVAGHNALHGAIAVSINNNVQTINWKSLNEESLLLTMKQLLSKLSYDNGALSVSRLLPAAGATASSRLQLTDNYLIDFGTRALPSAQVFIDTTSPLHTLASKPTMCAYNRSSLASGGSSSSSLVGSCYFPFVYDGVEYSDCGLLLSHRDMRANAGLDSVCSTVYNLTASPGSWGFCRPCGAQGNGFGAQLQPLKSSSQFVGNFDQVSSVLANLVYVPSMDAFDEYYSFLPAALTSFRDSVSVIADITEPSSSYKTFSALEVAVTVQQNVFTPVVNSALLSEGYCFEDMSCWLNGIGITDVLTSSSNEYMSATLWDMTEIVEVSLSVNNGDIFVLPGAQTGANASSSMLFFGTENITGQLYLLGTVRDVNDALSTLVYVPNRNWNSALPSTSPNPFNIPEAVQPLSTASSPSVQKLVISSRATTQVQVITTSINGPGNVHIHTNNSYFVLGLNCSQYSESVSYLTNFNKHSNVTNFQEHLIATTHHLAPDVTANTLAAHIKSLFAACHANMTHTFNTSNSDLFADVEVSVARAPVNGYENRNVFVWEVSLFPSTAYMRSNDHPFPTLLVISNNVTTSSDPLTSVDITVTKVTSSSLGGTFTLGFGGQWTAPISVSASGDEIVAAIAASITTINTQTGNNSGGLTVKQTSLYDPSSQRIGTELEFTYDHSVNWLSPGSVSAQAPYHLTTKTGDGSTVPTYAFGPMTTCINVDITSVTGRDVAYSCSVESVGSVNADTLTIAVNRIDVSAYSTGPVSVFTLPLYVLPVVDSPQIAYTGVDTTSTGVKVDFLLNEDSEIHLTQLSLMDVDDWVGQPSVLLNMTVYAPSGHMYLEIPSVAASFSNQYTISKTAHALTMIGSFEAISQLIGSCVFVPQEDFFGYARLYFTLSLIDSATNTLQSTTYLTLRGFVAPATDEISLNVSATNMVVQSSTAVPIPVVTIADPDDVSSANAYFDVDSFKSAYLANVQTQNFAPASQWTTQYHQTNINASYLRTYISTFTVTLSVSAGELLMPVLVLLAPGEYYATNWRSASSHTVSGDLNSLNSLLPFVKYVNAQPAGASSSCVLTVTLSSNRKSLFAPTSAWSTTQTVQITVLPASSSTGINLQSVLDGSADNVVVHMNEDGILTGLPIAILPDAGLSADPHAPILGSWDFVVHCSRGVLSTGATMVNAQSDMNILSTGAVYQIASSTNTLINEALMQSIIYTPPHDFSGVVTCTANTVVTLNSSSYYSASIDVLVVVDPVDDPPVITVSPQAPTTISGPTALSMFSVTDVDDVLPLLLTISCENGLLSVYNAIGDDLYSQLYYPEVYTDINYWASNVSVFVSAANASAFLSRVVYLPQTTAISAGNPTAVYASMDSVTVVANSMTARDVESDDSVNRDSLFVNSLNKRTMSASFTSSLIIAATTSQEYAFGIQIKSFAQFVCSTSALDLSENNTNLMLSDICSLRLFTQQRNPACILDASSTYCDQTTAGMVIAGSSDISSLSQSNFAGKVAVTINVTGSGELQVVNTTQFGQLYLLSLKQLTMLTPSAATVMTALHTSNVITIPNLTPAEASDLLSSIRFLPTTAQTGKQTSGNSMISMTVSLLPASTPTTVSTTSSVSSANAFVYSTPMTTSVYVNVVGVNDLPVISLSTSSPDTVVTLSTPITLSYVDVFDADVDQATFGYLQFSVSARIATVSLAFIPPASAGVLVIKNGTKSDEGILVFGSQDSLNAFITSGAVTVSVSEQSLLAQADTSITDAITSQAVDCAASAAGNDACVIADVVTITVDDNGFYGLPAVNGATTTTFTVPITIGLTNTEASVIVPPTAVVGLEDTTVPIGYNVSLQAGTNYQEWLQSLGYVSTAISHGTSGNTDMYRLVINTTDGILSINNTNNVLNRSDVFAGVTVSTSMRTTSMLVESMLVLSGPLDLISVVLPYLLFMPATDTNLEMSAMLTLWHAPYLSSSYVSSSKTLQLFVLPVNDAPTVELSPLISGPVTVTSGSWNTFPMNGLWSVNDVDFTTTSTQSQQSQLSAAGTSFVPLQTYGRNEFMLTVSVYADLGLVLNLQPSAELHLLTANNNFLPISLFVRNENPVYSDEQIYSGNRQFANTNSFFSYPNTADTGYGNNVDIIPIGYRSATIEGSLEFVNAYLNSLVIVAATASPTGEMGSTLSITVHDNGNFGTDADNTYVKSLSASATIDFMIMKPLSVPVISFSTQNVENVDSTQSFGCNLFFNSITDVDFELDDVADDSIYTVVVYASTNVDGIYPRLPVLTQSLTVEAFVASYVPTPMNAYPVNIIANAATLQNTSQIEEVSTPRPDVLGLRGNLESINAALKSVRFSVADSVHGVGYVQVSVIEYPALDMSVSSNGIIINTARIQFVALSLSPVLVNTTMHMLATQATGFVDPVPFGQTIQLLEDTPQLIPFRLFDANMDYFMKSEATVHRYDPMYCCSVTIKMVCNNCVLFNVTSSTPISADSSVQTFDYTTYPLASSAQINSYLSVINAQLSTIAVMGMPNFFGDASITVTLDDSATLLGSATPNVIVVPISVLAVPDAPIVVLPYQSIYTTTNAISGVSIEDQDNDGSIAYVVDISVDFGAVEVGSYPLSGLAIISTNVTAHTLAIIGNISSVNEALHYLTYFPADYFSGQDNLVITVAEVISKLSSSVSIPLYIQAQTPQPQLSVSISNSAFQVNENEVLSFSGFQAVEPSYTHTTGSSVAGDDAQHNQMNVLVRAAHGGALEIQAVATYVQHVDQVFSVYVTTTADDHFFYNGTFRLSVDLSAYGLGLQITEPIQYDAVANIFDERLGSVIAGEKPGESMQAKLESLPGFSALNITVHVMRNVIHPRLANPSNPTTGIAMPTGTKWEITLFNANSTLPAFTVAQESLQLFSNVTNSITTHASGLVTATVDRPANAIGGTFQLALGDLITAPLPHNCSEEDMAAALEALAPGAAVAVDRTQAPDLDGCFTWTVTFFSFPGYGGGNMPALVGLAANLTGAQYNVASNLPAYAVNVSWPIVSVKTLQDGVGMLQVYRLQTDVQVVNEVVDFTFATPSLASKLLNETQFFFVSVSNLAIFGNGNTYKLGPIFPTTDAMAFEQQFHPLPSIAKTERDTSLQTMFRQLPLFSQFARDVNVSKATLHINGFTKTRWRVTFIGASWQSLTFAVDTKDNEMEAGSYINITTIQHPNHVSGTFQLAVNGKYTPAMTYSVDGVTLTRALNGLATVHDPSTGIGSMIAARRGPNKQTDGYSWYIAVTQDAEDQVTSGMIQVQNLSLSVQNGTMGTIRISRLQAATSGYGFRLVPFVGTMMMPSVAATIPNGVMSLLDWQPYLSFTGTGSELTKALNSIQYQPAQNWHGNVSVIVRLVTKPPVGFETMFPSAEAVVVAPISVAAVNQAPTIYWRGVQLVDNEATAQVSLNVYEDSQVVLGHETLYYEDDTEFIKPYSNAYFPTSPEPNPQLGSAGLHEPRRSLNRFGFQIQDIDVGGGLMTVLVTVSRGAVSIEREKLSVGVSAARILQRRDATKDINIMIPESLANGTEAVVDSGVITDEQLTAASFSFTADIFTANMLLGSMKYQSPKYANGNDYINVTVWDNGNTGAGSTNLSCSEVLIINIMPVNDAPVISLTNVSLGTLYTVESSWPVGVIRSQEDMPVSIGQYFNISDPDFLYANIDPAQMNLQFPARPVPYTHSLGNSLFYVSLMCQYGFLSLPTVFTTISAYTSDAVVDNVNAAFNLTEETLSVTSAQSILLNQLADMNSTTTGRVIMLIGNYEDVVAALPQLTYTPNANWFGVDVFTVFVNDLGNYGVGGSKFLRRKVVIDVAMVPDTPKIAVPEVDLLIAEEDSTGIIGTDCCNRVDKNLYTHTVGGAVVNMSINSFQILDNDLLFAPSMVRETVRDTFAYVNTMTTDPLFDITYQPANVEDTTFLRQTLNNNIGDPQILNYTLRLDVSHGTLTMLRVPDDLQFTRGFGIGDDSIVVTGSLLDLNVALRGLQYNPDLNWNSRTGIDSALKDGTSTLDKLIISVSDDANKYSNYSLPIFVKAANDPPVLTFGKGTLHDTVRHTVDQLSRVRIDIATLQCQENTNCPLIGLKVSMHYILIVL